MLRKILINLLGGYPTVESWWYSQQERRTSNALQRQEATAALRDFKARVELARMRRILTECQEQARRGAAISTSRKIIGSGIDNATAAVILQRLYLMTSDRK